MNLFMSVNFALHSGGNSKWKIECDALTAKDWVTLAQMAAERLLPFREVEGVPEGGIAFAQAMRVHASKSGPLLICDDVLSTGASMYEQRGQRDAIGVVVFSRSDHVSAWITALFQLASPFVS